MKTTIYFLCGDCGAMEQETHKGNLMDEKPRHYSILCPSDCAVWMAEIGRSLNVADQAGGKPRSSGVRP